MTTAISDSEVGGWVPTDKEFGTRLALVRQRMGWNVAEAARECGLSPESWRLWETTGRTPIRIIEASAKIAARTGVNRYWLMMGPDALNGRYERVNGTVVTKIPSVTLSPRPRSGLPTTRPVEATRIIQQRSRSVSLVTPGD